MEFGLGTYGLGVLAGLLSTLSPCVLLSLLVHGIKRQTLV
jgi:cytochrome c biogenesis protein CcdA